MKETLRNLFQQKFNRDEYRRVVLQNLLHAQQLLREPQFLEETNDGDRIYGLGYLHDADGKEIGLYYTDVVNGDVRRKRVGFRQMMKPYVKYGADAAIAVFADKEHWRLSYMCDLKGGETSAKRFSYVFGDPKGQYNTPSSRLANLGGKKIVLDDLKETFSVEALSKEFFKEYHEHYDCICDNIISHPHIDALTPLRIHDYVKKMMGRIVFLHFLQKKRWLDDDPEFLKNLFFMQPLDRKADFLEQVLEPLFFGIFNTESDQREKLFADEHWDKGLLKQWEKLPYLNGGLFERDEVDKLKIKLPASLFEDLFSFMASYNFTVDENDPDDAEVGVDPEMLGKIFESLLEDNKAKGAFYTPKEIVRYMCKESLIAYLATQIDKSQSEQKEKTDSSDGSDCNKYIRAFVETHEMQPELEPYRDTLDAALREVKICDPAIGSGAFPMGLLNELWRCREAIEATSSRVELKKEIIENNIYGVDIEKGAIDIARLRFWLSIVVDAEKPEPLPNFDYKFMQGNSLIESFEGFDLSRISSRLRGGQSKSMQLVLGIDSHTSRQNLQRLLREYFSVTDHKQKASMRQAINEEVKTLIRESIGGTPASLAKLEKMDCSANQDFFLWHTWFKDIFDKDGFDIVIANPPYGAKYGEEEKRYYKTIYNTAKTIHGKQKGSLDTYTLFIEHGYNLLRNGGSFAYIVPISLTSSDSLAGVHKLLLSNCDNIHISSYAVRPVPVFERAVVNTSILMFQKTKTQCNHLFSTKMYRRRKDEEFDLQHLVSNLQFVDVKDMMLYGRIPKIGTELERNILERLFTHNRLSQYYNSIGNPIYYRTTGGRYFKVVTNYPTGSTKEKPLLFEKNYANAIGCILSSNLSFWFYQIYSNNLDWKSYEIDNFSIPKLTEKNIAWLEAHYEKYLQDIEKNANIRTSTGESKYLVDSFKEYKIVRSKSIIDEIDDYIGPLYGLTQEEINFIKNYELEFRMAGE